MRELWRICFLAAALALSACNRKIEPFDPNEQPHQPDLSKIFPAGAERAERAVPGLPPAPDGGRGAAPVAAESGPPIHGVVRLAAGLEGRVPSGAVLFLIARRPDGGPPLAVKRIADARFPLEFELGPDDRMIEALPFAGPMTVTARIDADGNASSRTPGDLFGASGEPVEPGATGIEVVIDQAVGAESAGAAESGGSAALAAAGAPSGSESGAPIHGTVRIAAQLADRIPSGAVLFLIARRGEGGPPLAVKRIERPTFPLDFALGPEDRMIQAMPFAGPLTITARLDADGNAMSRSPGDLFGASASPVQPGASGVDVVIDQSVPGDAPRS